MRFTVLGPLAVVGEGGEVALGGANQRAVLGFLLLHPNRVVGTGELVRALWGDGAPATARKMVQNAVAGLRRVLRADGTAQLVTVPPGYTLRVDPAAIDMTRFDDLVRRGRAELKDGAWEAAARLLREALSLWRGPMLADVAATGVDWPVLAIVQELRLTAFEDCAEAELALGRHREVVAELAALPELELVRERASGLLMLALYRCGRHPEALAVYQRLRDELLERYGLDPAPELQDLERAILDQRPALTWESAPGAAPRGAVSAATPPAGGPQVGGAAGRPFSERKRASVLLVRARPAALPAAPGAPGADDPEHADEALRDLHRVVAEEAARYGGAVRDPLGSVRPVLFGLPRTREDDPHRAVRTALAIRDRLARTGSPTDVHLAVATGEVLAGYRDEGDDHPAELTGAVLDHCEHLLALSSAEGVRICAATSAADPAAYVLRGGAGPGGPVDSDGPVDPDGLVDPAVGRDVLALALVPAAEPAWPHSPLVGRRRELRQLNELLGDALRKERPHLVTVLGESGIGKSRLVAEFAALVDRGAIGEGAVGESTVRPGAAGSGAVLRLSGRVPPYGGGRTLGPLASALRQYAGVADADPPALAERRLSGVLGELTGSGPTAARLLRGLRPLLDHGRDDIHDDGRAAEHDGGRSHARRRAHDGAAESAPPDAVFAAWASFVAELATQRPLVLLVEDVQHADDPLLDHLEGLTEQLAGLPVLIVATARPELRSRRPHWACGTRDTAEITLDPLSDAATLALLDHLLPEPPRPAEATAPPPHADAAAPPETRHPADPGQPPPHPALLPDRPPGPAEPTDPPPHPALLGNRPSRVADAAAGLLPLIGGIPRYAQEYAAALAALPPGTVVPPVPARVRIAVAARIDTLPAAHKCVLRNAAVFGGPVWAAGVAEVSGRDPAAVEEALRHLERADFLRRVRPGTLPGQTEYAFRQVLLREVGAAQLPRRDRAAAHRAAIGWITALPPDHAGLLVHHHRQLVALATATGLPAQSAADEAGRALTAAGDRAAEAGAYETAARCYRGAVELGPDAGDARGRLVLLHRQRLRAPAGEPTATRMCG